MLKRDSYVWLCCVFDPNAVRWKGRIPVIHKTRPSGANNKSRLSFVVCREKWRAMLLSLIVCGGLIVTTMGYAQSLEPISDVAVGPDDNFSNIVATKEQEDLQREYARAVQDLMDERETAMRANWDAFEEAKNSIISSFLSAIRRPPIVGPRFSTNAFGATYRVPNGSYSGDALVGLVEVTRQDDPNATPVPIARAILRGQLGLRHFAGGWNFEPGGMLKETYSLVSATVAQTSPGFVTQCKVVDR